MYKVVPFLRVRYGDVAQNGPADDVVAVATGLFLKGAGLTPESMQTVTSLKKILVPPRADYFCLADRSVCVAMCTLQCKEEVLFSKIL